MKISAHILYYPIGWLYFWISYRNKEKVKRVLQEKYDGDYYSAGVLLIWTAFGALLFVLISLLLLAVIGRIIYDLVK